MRGQQRSISPDTSQTVTELPLSAVRSTESPRSRGGEGEKNKRDKSLKHHFGFISQQHENDLCPVACTNNGNTIKYSVY